FTPPAFAPTGDAPTRTLKLNLDERNTPADGAPAVSTATLTVYPNPASVSSVTVLDGGDQPHTAGVTTGVTYRALIGRPTVFTMSYRYTIIGGGCFQVPDCVSEITCPGAGTACGDGSATFTADLARGSTVAVAVEELNAIGAAAPAVSSGAQPVLAPPAPPAITAFSLAGVAGTIDEAGKAIAVTVPYGAALTALVATFTTTGVSVKVGATAQTSGVTANDFTSPVAYVVTSADGSTVVYTVTVTPAPNPAKALTAFSLAGVDATIDESGKAIAVTVPYGTDATALVATFTTSGASVEVGTTAQTSGVTANDFTNPVKYTVTAADGSTSTYTVTVTVAGPPDPLPRTGQTVSYATGDDGNLLKGEAWPSPRFTTNADTTVTDHLTGLVWAPDASTPGPGACNPGGTRTWQGAVDHVACLNANAYLGQTDWRLPNRNELGSLSHYGQPDAAAWLDGQGFTSASSGNFWSSTIYLPAYSLYVWIAGIEGSLDGSSATSLLRVWPVRTGSSPGAIALPATGQTTCLDATMAPIACAGTGQDGDLRAGAAWPSPRFTVNGDTTVTDNLTGRTWTAAADSPGPAPCPGGLKTWQAALGHVACLNANGYLGHSDWRLPNIHELESLANPNESSTATWLMTQGFGYVPTSYDLWSSTTVASNTSLRWIVDMNGGGVYGYPKTDTYFVWPVR
ncbi:MAG TPA: DUF1566 domain-containing protein, partial [Solirubrobacter sp.]